MQKRRRRGGLPALPLRKLALWGVGLLVGLILLIIIGYSQLLSYLQGESFRDSLEKSLANKARAESVEIDGTLAIDANRVSLRGAELTRPGVLHGLRAGGIHAELNRAALFNRELHLTRVAVEEATLTLNREDADATLPAVRKSSGGFLSGLAPERVRLERATCNHFNTDLRIGERNFALTGSELEVLPAPRQGKKAWEFRLSNGRLHSALPILGDCSLKTATLTWGGKVNSLSDARLMLSPGELIINAMQETATHNWSADLRINKMDIGRLLSADWKKRLSGGLYAQLDMSGNAEGIERAEGRISLQQGVLEALPILAQLPVGNTTPYRRLQLEQADARLSYPYTDASRNIRRAWLLDDINIRGKDGKLLVKGHVMVDADGTLGGTLHIGLPTDIATLLAPEGTPLFGSLFHREGESSSYLWLRLNLSGTLQDPQEDLSARLMTLVGGVAQQASGVLNSLLSVAGGAAETAAPSKDEEESRKEPTPAPGNSLINKAGNAAQDVINTGLRGLF